MSDTKLFKLVQVLLPSELMDIERYLAVPFINTNSDVVTLFSKLRKFHPGMDSPELTKERLYRKLFGKQPYNDGKMRKLMTQLTQLIEQYLIQIELKKSEELRTKLLARSLGERSNYGLFFEVVESRLKKLEKQAGRGRDYFRESFELSESLYYHPESDKLNKRSEYLNRAIGDFERYFTLVMLQNEADNVVRTRLVKGNDLSFYKVRTKEAAKLPAFASYNAIQFFHKLVTALEDRAAEDLDQLKESAFKAFGQLNRFEQDFAINLLRNYAVPMVNRGSLPHRRFVFDMYKIELERGLMVNTISAVTFMNIVSMGLLEGEFDWVEHFIINFSHCLPDDESEMTLNFCKGIWHYQQGLESNELMHFYDAVQFINLIPIRTGAKYEVRVRPTLLRIHFEIFKRGEETLDELLNRARNFERHLNGSEDYAEPVRNTYLNFLRFFKSLARLVSNPNLNNNLVVAFLEKLDLLSHDIALKIWLQKKAEELINKD